MIVRTMGRMLPFFLLSFTLCIQNFAQAQLFTLGGLLAPVATSVSSIDLADLDGDGYLDMVTVDNGAQGLTWRSNDGTGSFDGIHVLFSSSVYDSQMIDFDQDADMDIVAIVQHPVGLGSILVWFENEGLDGLSSALVLDTIDTVTFSSLYVADIDNDSDLDVALASRFNDVIWTYTNDGNQNMTAAILDPISIDTPEEMLVRDLTGDGFVDIVCASTGSNELLLFPNDGAGGFLSQLIITNTVSQLRSFDLGDIDGDGDLDVVIASYFDNTVFWLENDGTGLFGTSHEIEDYLWKALHVELKDMDGDGDIDAIAFSGNTNDTNWYENLDGGMTWATHVVSSLYSSPTVIAAGNLDDDPETEILLTGTFTDNITRFDPINGTQYMEDIVVDGGPVGAVYTIASADLNNDGDMDIISGCNCGGNTFLVSLTNDGPAIFGSKTNVPVSVTGSPEAMELHDLNGDNYPDLVKCSNGTLEIMLNDGQGNLIPSSSIPNLTSCPFQLFLEDMDQDGDIDILKPDLNIGWYANDGLGNFGTLNLLNSDYDFYTDAIMTDTDQDGILDVVASGDGYIFMMRGTGNGVFESGVIIGSGANRDLEAHDLNDDGYPEIIFGGSYTTSFLPNYDGQFYNEVMEINGFTSSTFKVMVRDVNMDGLPDVISGDVSSGSRLVWFANEGGLEFGPRQTIATGLNDSRDFIAEDLDSDGDVDVAFFIDYPVSELRWYENHANSGCLDPAACNYTPGVAEDDGSCCYSDCGCTDPVAENYDELATCDNGTCTYTYGCTDPNADNFDPAVGVDDGSCRYNISGAVYHDSNENGFFEFWESGVANQELSLNGTGLSTFSDNDGNYYFDELLPGNYEIVIGTNDVFPINTSASSLPVILGGAAISQQHFGISDEEALHAITVAKYTTYGMPCNEYVQYVIGARNDGTETISAVVSLEYDPLYQNYEEVFFSPIDSVIGTTIYMSIDSLIPGAFVYNQVKLLNPTVDYIGEFLQLDARVWGTIDGDSVAYGQDVIPFELLCSYDPNDKQVYPNGWTEEHYVQRGNQLEYLIRFQNLGNAPAIDVRVQDTLDAPLDIESLDILSYSHPVHITLDSASRVLDFFFEEVFLPDATSDELGSHGFVSYTIDHEDDTDLLTEIENTAFIYFDNNPPIITNTTWSTLYDCSLFEATFEWQDDVLVASEGETYQWYFNGDTISNGTSQEYSPGIGMGSGTYSVGIGSGFPCTSLSESQDIIWFGIDEYAIEQVRVIPNPISDEAICDLGTVTGTVQLEIMDPTGRVLSSTQQQVIQGQLILSRKGLLKGIYRFRVIDETGEDYRGSFVAD